MYHLYYIEVKGEFIMNQENNWQKDAVEIGKILKQRYDVQPAVDAETGVNLSPPSFSDVTLEDLGKQTMTY